jgi:hypothetical protein
MKRRVGLFLMVGAMLPLGVASTAWACASLATVALSKQTVAPGDTVTVTGKGYSDTHAGSNAGDSDVTIRLNGRRGQVLGHADPDSTRRISTTMQVPKDVRSGWYIITATQFGADGTTPKAGMPGRTVMKVSGSASNSAGVAPWGSSKPAGPGASSLAVAGDGGGLSSQTLLLGMGLSLTLLAAGSVLVGRRNQTTSRLTLGV